jgi:hypothetical protein
MLENLKAVAAKAKALWTGVSAAEESGTEIVLPNGARVTDLRGIQEVERLKRAPLSAVEDWYASTLPEAPRYSALPIALVDELVVNARVFRASCRMEELPAANYLQDAARIFTYAYIGRQRIDIRETAAKRFKSQPEHVGRNEIEPIKKTRTSQWILPTDDVRAEWRRAALENLKDVANAIGKRHDSHSARKDALTTLWYVIGCIDAGTIPYWENSA